MQPIIEKTLILAHRGASGYAPENTMEAFELAAKMGADGIELDVHFAADGAVVVCHDEKIDRTSNGQGLITDYTLSELKSMDFGYHFYGEQRKGVKIPTLDEVYEFVAPIGMVVNVEIKSADPDIIKACDIIAEKYGNHVVFQKLSKKNTPFPTQVFAHTYLENGVQFNYAATYASTDATLDFSRL